ncbi:MAG: NADP-dependent oxidoreductase [Sciscionella sp.]
MTEQASEIRLASRPHGAPTQDNFHLVEVDLPKPEAGQVLVRNMVMSVDPYMRGRMSDAKSYVPPYVVGEALSGAAVGEVIESTVDTVNSGDLLLHSYGWRTHAALDPTKSVVLDRSAAPISAYLGVLGMPGMTAYVGLVKIAEFRKGDTVFVSGAAGAVGSAVGQLARLRGATRVIGSAGSAAKVAYLTEELCFDAAFNYKEAPVRESLRAAAPDGIDVYFDNVGGEHLEAAIGALNDFGRIAACGAISAYNATEAPAGPRNMSAFVKSRLKMQGFIVGEHPELRESFFAEVAPLVANGRLKYSETVVAGLPNAPQAFIDLLNGANTGKMIVTIAD